MPRVLIVDDEKGIRRALGAYLRPEGYEVREAADAATAVELLKDAELDVVVTDITMPGLTGVELLRHIHTTAPQVQVIMMTGAPTVESASESLRAGAVDYLLKPFAREDFLRVVANAVRIKTLHDDKRRLEAANRAHQENLERLVKERTTQLRETEQKLIYAMRLARLVAWEFDVASGLFSFSDDFYALHGTTTELEGGNVMAAEAFARKFVHPDDAHLVGEEIAKATASADPDYRAQFEARVFRRDGEVRHVLVHIAVTKDAAGRTVQLRGANQDITERKESERELRKLWRAVEQTPATVVITDVSGSIEYVNPKFVEVTGYTVAEALGQNPRVLKSGKQPQSFYKAMWETLLRGDVWQGELQNRKKNGEIYWETATISPVRDPKGETTHFIAVKEDITARKKAAEELKQAEEALCESERRQKAILDNIPDPAWLKDGEGRYLTVNRAWCNLFGVEAKQVVGRTSACANQPEVARRVQQEDDRIMSSGLPLRQEEQLVSGKSGEAWFETFKTALVDERGVIYGLAGIARDITKRKRSEAALLESQRFLQSTLNALSAHIAILDEEGVIVEVNAAWNQFAQQNNYLGSNYGRGTNYLSLCESAVGDCTTEAPAVAKGIRAVMAGKCGEFLLEYPCHSPQEQRWFVVRVTRFSGAGPVRVVVAHENITARKRAEEKLRASQQLIEGILNAIPVRVFWKDKNLVFLGCNAAFARDAGFADPKDIIGKDDYHMVWRDQAELYRDADRRIIESGCARLFIEEPHTTREGNTLTVLTSKVPLRNSKGEISGVLGTYLDITGQKQAEAELLATNCHLEAATARANEMAIRAELASSAKSEFVANMSHELRTPMNGVLGMIGLLLDTDLSANQRRYAETVRASGEILLALINDILDFSKIEAGKLDLETLDFSLHCLLDDFTRMMAQRAHEKGLILGCVVAPDVPSDLRGDPGRLRQILTNLAGNAIKFTAQGEVIIRVSVVLEAASGVLVRFAVRDTGIGIPADKLEKLFTKFSQVDSSTTRTYGGTGLGLAISKQLAELMGGEIGVESEPGKGSEFWFTLCLAKASTCGFTAAPAPAELHGVRVLVVDDRPVNREILLVLLESWGLRAVEAADSQAALEALTQAQADQDPFVVAILDAQMPGMDGMSLGRAIKSDPNLRDTRLVICTSLGQLGNDQPWEEVGFVATLTKPVPRSELLEVLRAVITGRQATTSRTSAKPSFPFGQGLRPARILVADDSSTNQQVAVGMLKKLGLRADVVANGSEAVRAVETVSYDLVLMDVQMPEMDGLEATRQIRKSEQTGQRADGPAVLPHIPIIAMTAHALQGDRERCLAVGMDDYVTKPVELLSLVAAFEKWLPPRSDCRLPLPGEAEGEVAASTSEEKLPVFNRGALMNRIMNDEDLARVVIEGFLGDLPDQIKQLKGYAAAGEIQHVEQQAHKIKGASATVSGEALSALAGELEQAGKAGDLGIISARMPELDAQFAALKEALKNK